MDKIENLKKRKIEKIQNVPKWLVDNDHLKSGYRVNM